MKLLVLLAAGLGVVCGSAFLEDGREYVFEEEGSQIAATLDYSASAAATAYKGRVKLQVHGNDVHVKYEDYQYTRYNGEYEPAHFDWNTKTTFVPWGPEYEPSTITYDHGRVVGLKVPSSYTKLQRNIMKAFASNFQIDLQHEEHSTEHMIHGDCRVHYTKNDHLVTRSVSHMADCLHRKYRLVDQFRGERCDHAEPMEAQEVDGHFKHGRKQPEPLFSHTENFFFVEKKGDRYKVNKMVSTHVVKQQMFETGGVSKNVYFIKEMKLVEDNESPNDIHVAGENHYDNLAYEWSDDDYSWNDEIELKNAEPFYSGEILDQRDQSILKQRAKDIFNGIVANFERHDNSESTVEELHKFGISNALRPLLNMNYDTLMGLWRELKSDTSDAGVTKRNLFSEFIGSVGTRASAMVVKDAIEGGMFENDRDAARALSSVAFHIRRPNKALYNAFHDMTIPAEYNAFTMMAFPLARSHLARRTCEYAGDGQHGEHSGDFHSNQDFLTCITEISDPLADEAFTRLTGGDYEAQMLALSEMINLRWGKVAEKMRTVYSGEEASVTIDSVKARAVAAAGFQYRIDEHAVEHFLPVFLNSENGHEVRIGALHQIFLANYDATTLATIMTSLYFEKDYEVINYAFTIFEKYAHSINPCNHGQAHQSIAAYFLNYMKQGGFHHTNYGFGISKTYNREFQKEKYGYGGAWEFNTIGSHHSTTPLVVNMAITSNHYHGYQADMFEINLRIEGLAKAVIRQFKKLPEAQWKLADLATVLHGMGVESKPDQPVRVEVAIALKGAVVFQRMYDENDARPGGKIAEFLKTLGSAAKSGGYSINHQRALVGGAVLYEQPTDSGFPMIHLQYVTTMASVKAVVKATTERGSIGRDIDYDLNMNTHATTAMGFHNPEHPDKTNSYYVQQDRVYGFHIKATIKAKVQLLGDRYLQLYISRCPYNNPFALIMHSKTMTAISPDHDYQGVIDLSSQCSDCHQFHTVSKGESYKRDRVFVDRTDEFLGSYMHGEYFRCEMDIARKNTVLNAINAFSPMNKNPKTPWTMFAMGMEQILSFFLYFPKAEQCGAYFRWSQSEEHPVTEIGVKIMAKAVNKEGGRLFYRGRQVLIKMDVIAKGSAADQNRLYKVNAEYDMEPGHLQNRFTFKVSRKANLALGMPDYTVCMSYNSQYSDFGDEVATVDMSRDLQVSGVAMLNYGSGVTKCGALPSGIKVDFLHSSTAQSRAEVQNTWYGHRCEEDMRRPEWQERVSHGGAPLTDACWLTQFDAAKARKYTWSAHFKGLTERAKAIISKAQTVVEAGLLPFWDVDPEALTGSVGDSPFLKMNVEFKDNEQFMDIRFETRYGVSEFLNKPVRLPGWTDRLRNLRYPRTLSQLMAADIINPCVQTMESVKTVDNTTLPYHPQDYWSLISGHCSEKPTYAVFTKSAGSGMDLKAYIGGHKIVITKNGQVAVNDAAWTVGDQEMVHMEGDQEIFKLYKWGTTYNIYSSLKVWIMYDGTFAEVIPAPSVKGQHCGVCGNYDMNRKNELLGKNGQVIDEDHLAEEWRV